MKRIAWIQWLTIALVCVLMSGCAGMMDGLKSAGWLDGMTNYRNHDVADVAADYAALGIDPSTIPLTQVLTPDQKAKFAESAAAAPPPPAPVVNIIIDAELLKKPRATENPD